MSRSKSKLGDVRLDRVHKMFLRAMSEKLTVVLRKLSKDKTEEVCYGRFINNAKITPQSLINHYWETNPLDFSGKHILLVEDSTSASFGFHQNRDDLGHIEYKTKNSGFFLHPCLYMDGSDGGCYGIGGLSVRKTAFAKTPEEIEARAKRQKELIKMPFKDEDRYKWYSTAAQAIHNNPSASMYTVVGDREADIYDLFAHYQSKGWHYVIRSAYNRNVKNEDGSKTKLHSTIEKWGVNHTYSIDLPATDKRSAHKAKMELKFGKVHIMLSSNNPDKTLPKTLPIYVVQAKEDPSTVVGKQKPVHWILFTSHPVTDTAQALQIIQWYRWRWVIEQVFRTLKSKGLNIEKSEVESFHALVNLSVLALMAAVLVLQLTQARSGQTKQKTDMVFSEKEQQCLNLISEKLEGRTAKTKNPHPQANLAFAAWVMARLGGWKGYQKSRPPGPITILNGLIRFNDIAKGFFMII